MRLLVRSPKDVATCYTLNYFLTQFNPFAYPLHYEQPCILDTTPTLFGPFPCENNSTPTSLLIPLPSLYIYLLLPFPQYLLCPLFPYNCSITYSPPIPLLVWLTTHTLPSISKDYNGILSPFFLPFFSMF